MNLNRGEQSSKCLIMIFAFTLRHSFFMIQFDILLFGMSLYRLITSTLGDNLAITRPHFKPNIIGNVWKSDFNRTMLHYFNRHFWLKLFFRSIQNVYSKCILCIIDMTGGKSQNKTNNAEYLFRFLVFAKSPSASSPLIEKWFVVVHKLHGRWTNWVETKRNFHQLGHSNE